MVLFVHFTRKMTDYKAILTINQPIVESNYCLMPQTIICNFLPDSELTFYHFPLFGVRHFSVTPIFFYFCCDSDFRQGRMINLKTLHSSLPIFHLLKNLRKSLTHDDIKHSSRITNTYLAVTIRIGGLLIEVL